MSSSIDEVWVQTSTKRGKLVELCFVLKYNKFSLDDAASWEEMLDLNLANVLWLVVAACLQDFEKHLQVEEESNESKIKDSIDSSMKIDREMQVNQYNINLNNDHQHIQNPYQQCVGNYHALPLKHSITTIRSSWDTIISIADVDIDRAVIKDASSSSGDAPSL